MQYMFDASSIIFAWENYPPDNFPPLWNWLAERIQAGEFCMADVACLETGRKLPDCEAWLHTEEIQIV